MKKKPLSDKVVARMWDEFNKKEIKKEAITPMEEFEIETGKHAIWNGRITKQYQIWCNKRYGKK